MTLLPDNKDRQKIWLIIILAGLLVVILSVVSGWYYLHRPPPKPKNNVLELIPRFFSAKTLLWIRASDTDDFDSVRIILEHYPELVNLKDHYGLKEANPVYITARGGNTKALEYFLSKGMDPDFYYFESTPLDTAIGMDRPEVVEILAHYGVDMNAWPELPIEFRRGEEFFHIADCTPLFSALLRADRRRTNDWSVADMLQKYGADINQLSPNGYAPLHCAVNSRVFSYSSSIDTSSSEKRLQLFKYLLSKPTIDVNVTSAVEHKTPLHFALSSIHAGERQQRMEIIKLLIEHGARTDIKDYKGNTVFDYVKKNNNGNREILTLLAKAKNPPLVKEERD